MKETMSASPSTLQPAQSRITLRAVILGCILMPINAYWIGMEEMLWHGFHFTATSIPMNVIFIVFVLALLNYIAQRFFPAYALSQAELLVIYIMLACVTAVVAHDNMVGLMGPPLPRFLVCYSRKRMETDSPALPSELACHG